MRFLTEASRDSLYIERRSTWELARFMRMDALVVTPWW